jgi:RNA polymerase sigma-70 factor, ECF subfamily
VNPTVTLTMERPIVVEPSSSSFRERAEAVSRPAWRCLRRFGVPMADVDDCLQLVLMQLYDRWDQLGHLPPNELRSYACCVATGVARVAARKRQRRDRASGDLAGEVVAEGTPESLVARQQAIEQLDAVLSTLSEDRREVFVLFELEGLTGPEIAEHLGVPVGTVASRLRRGRADFEAAAARLLTQTRRERG